MKKAFTLLELLVVVAIIAMLATLSIISITGWREKTTKAKVFSDMRESMKIVNACKTFGGEIAKYTYTDEDKQFLDYYYKPGEPICTNISNEASTDNASLTSGNWPTMPNDTYGTYNVGGAGSNITWYVKHNPPGDGDPPLNRDILTCTESGCQKGVDW